MKAMRMNLLGAAALALFLITLYAHFANAATPGDRIWRVSDTATVTAGKTVAVVAVYGRNHDRPAGRIPYRLTTHDREVASRLSAYSGVSERRLLRQRRLGCDWIEIARRLELSPRAVRAAQDALSWHRFLRRTTTTVGCEIGGDPRCAETAANGRRAGRGR